MPLKVTGERATMIWACTGLGIRSRLRQLAAVRTLTSNRSAAASSPIDRIKSSNRMSALYTSGVVPSRGLYTARRVTAGGTSLTVPGMVKTTRSRAKATPKRPEDPRDPLSVEMGARLRALREFAGVSQRELSDAVSKLVESQASRDELRRLIPLSPSRIGNWEQGTKQIGVREGWSLARALQAQA